MYSLRWTSTQWVIISTLRQDLLISTEILKDWSNLDIENFQVLILTIYLTLEGISAAPGQKKQRSRVKTFNLKGKEHDKT